MKAILSTAGVAVGVVLLLASFVWGILFPASSGWSEEKSARLQELRTRAHILIGEVASAKEKPTMHGGSNAAELEAEFTQVKVELQQLADELEGKIEGPKTAASLLRWTGVAFVLAGALTIYAGRG